MQKALWSQNIWKGVNEAEKMSKKKMELKHCELSYVPASCYRMREIKLDTIIENPTFSQLFSCCHKTLLLLKKSTCFLLLHLLTAFKELTWQWMPFLLMGPRPVLFFSQILFNIHFLHASLTSFLSLLFTFAYLLDSCHEFQVCFCYLCFPMY